MKENYIATFILHALGDTIGYNNSIWEFNYNDVELHNDYRITLEIISEFISLGGITNINLKKWNVSDDTLINYEIAKFVLSIKNNLNEQNIIELKKNIKKMALKQNVERGFGSMTINAIDEWTDKKDQRNEPYNNKSGGNGCTMRTFSIGLRYYKDNDLEKLIDVAITSSMLTHNSPIGFLGGLGSAYFVKLAIDKIDIKKWPSMFIKLLESENVKKYIELFFDENNKNLKFKTKLNLIGRIKLFIDLNEFVYPDSKYNSYAGSTGPTALIMAYDSLLESDGIWEKLVYYAMLHSGDSDTVGAIAGGLFGIKYGFKTVPEHLLKNLELKKELEEIGEQFYNLYQKF